MISLLTYFLLLPYSQKTANSHMNLGPLFGEIYYMISALMLLIGLNLLMKHKDIKVFILLLVFSGTLIYWGYRLHSLYCLGCANGG
jgi:hypothetical protein